MMKKIKTDKNADRNSILHLAAFLIPAAVLAIAYIRRGIAPFGGESLLSMDLWSQYFPMLTEQWRTRREFASALFSWNGAFGFNSYAQSAYYCNSLFNWLLVPFPKSGLIGALDTLILLKTALSGFTMSLYLRYRMNRPQNGVAQDGFFRGDMSVMITVCSAGYALCAYNLAFINQIMWTDAVVYFPLVLLGFERLMLEKKPFMYCAMLALTIYSCFYISFSVCLFLVIYFFFFAGQIWEKGKLADIVRSGLRFALYSLVAGGSMMFVIIPIYRQISITIASDIPAPDNFAMYNSFFEYVLALLPRTAPSLEYGVPNIYSGGFVFLLVPLYFLNKKIPPREKGIHMLLLVFLILSMDVNVLNYIWHGFHFPNQLPGRWTFIFSFVVMSMCCRAFENYRDFSVPKIALAGGVSAALIAVSYVFAEQKPESRNLILAVAFIVIYTVMFIVTDLFKKEKFHRTVLCLLCAAMIVETGSNAVYTVDSRTEIGNNAKFNQFNAVMDSFAKGYSADGTDFWRTDIYENWTFDSPMLFGTKGTTYYSSTMSAGAFNFFKSMGMRVYAKNVSSIYTPYSPVTNALFSVKYVANRNMIALPYGMKTLGQLNGTYVTAVENSCCLPVAFVCDSSAKNWKPSVRNSYLQNQDSFFSVLSGDGAELFTRLEWDSREKENALVFESGTWQNSTFSCSDRGSCSFSFGYIVKESGEYYLCDNFTKGACTIKVNDEVYTPYIDRVTHVCLGRLNKGDRVSVTVEENGVEVSYYGMEIYSFDSAAFQKKFDALGSEGMNVTKCVNGRIEGTIKSASGGTVCAGIGQENGGFTVTVDGKEVRTDLIAGYLLAFDIPAGLHNVVIDYSVPGLRTGIAVSVPFALLFAALFALSKKEKFVL